jgi:hypothetical protein
VDQEVLVDLQFDEGRALLEELVHAKIDIAVAFWVKPPEKDEWVFHVASKRLSSMTAGDAFIAVFEALNRIQSSTIDYSDVKHAKPTSPAAAKAIEVRDRHSAISPIRLRAKKLGDLPIEEAYIYPRTAGALSRDEVVQTVAALMSRSGAFVPPSITLRDGSSIQAVPTSIQLGVPGELRIVLHDLEGNTDRTISADEVVSIH